LGHQQPDRRKLILPVLGVRGKWLAAQNPAWHYATDRDPKIAWETENRLERLARLQSLREESPAQARELLLETWAEETPKDRAAFLKTFATGLSQEDEAFLETALDDRRQEVRVVAADLLSHLPESRLCRRMSTRVEPLLMFKKGLLGATSLTVTLPNICDKVMIRDGVESKSAPVMLGQKSWWLAQMLAAIPPQVWSDKWRETPAILIAAAHKNDDKKAILLGWAIAARRHKDPVWLEALAQYWLSQQDSYTFLAEAGLFRAFHHIPPAKLETVILRGLRASLDPLHDYHPVIPFLRMESYAWSEKLSRTIIKNIQQRIRRDARLQGNTWQLRTMLRDFARHIPVTLAGELTKGWPSQASSADWEKAVNEFLGLLHFRREMLERIQKEQ
jgi:hypothetical protein